MLLELRKSMPDLKIIERQAFDVEAALFEQFGGELHQRQIRSLSDATLGVMNSASLAVSIVGQALAQAKSLDPRHAIKQVDRLLSNTAIAPWDLFALWVPRVVGARGQIQVAMDWTEFDPDGQSTLMLSMIDPHGAAVPLIWLSMWKDELTKQRNDIEDACLARLKECLPDKVRVIILADRGFGDAKLFKYLPTLGFGYVIRFRDNITVTSKRGEKRLALEWVQAGQARKLVDPQVTAKKMSVPAIVFARDKLMKEPWCLATSETNVGAREIVSMYGKRWRIEPGFRDTKDLRFGMGMSAMRLNDPERRDRLLLLNAFATFFLILLGVAGEAVGMDKRLRCGTSKKRTHSLFRQRCMLFDLIPTMRDAWLKPLLNKFVQLLENEPVLHTILQIC
jgi:hypothetical protein